MSTEEPRIPALDVTQDERLLDKLPRLQHKPRLDVEELREAAAVFDALPGDLTYPILSFTDLLDKLGGVQARITIAGVNFRPADMSGRIPASYFPIGSADDFVAKVGELIARNRQKVPDPSREYEKIRRVVPRLTFPITDRRALREAIGNRRIPFGRVTRTAQQVAAAVSDDYFPITSEDDLQRKAFRLMQKRPLIEPPHRERS